MTETPRSSFIPKQAVAAPSRTRRRGKYNIFGFVATAVLLGAIVLSVGVFFYKDLKISQLEGEKEALRQQRTLFNESDIAKVRDLDAQLEAGLYLLGNHAAFSKVFDTLQLTTKESVQFTGITLERRPSDDVSVVVQGATEEFTAVALQAMQFSKDDIMRNSIFTDITTDDTSTEDLFASVAVEEGEDEPHVTFSVEGNIDAEKLRFEVASVATDVDMDTLPIEQEDIDIEEGSTVDTVISEEDVARMVEEVGDAVVDTDSEVRSDDNDFE